jgi:protein-arginine kinase activator protein McsA
MKEAAQRLEFETAAELRDRIRALQEQELALREPAINRSADA